MRCHRRSCMHYTAARLHNRADDQGDRIEYDKLLKIFVIIYSIGSVYVAAYAYMRFRRTQETLVESELTTVTRDEWNARQAKFHLDVLDVLPTRLVIVIHTATDNCDNVDDCSRIVKGIQDFHMDSLGLYDIGYNFLVGGDGRVYAGRGWGVAGSHTWNFDRRSLGLAFIGNFSESLPPKRQVRAFVNLIDEGVKLGHVGWDHWMVGQRQCVPTLSPGDQLYEDIKYWKHWWSICK